MKVLLTVLVAVVLFTACATGKVGRSTVRAWYPFYRIEATTVTVTARPDTSLLMPYVGVGDTTRTYRADQLTTRPFRLLR